MSEYTNKQKEYIDSVGGEAHQSAVKIIGQLQAELKTKDEEIERLKEVLEEIRDVACGKEQIECDGAYDDSDGLRWIYERILALEICEGCKYQNFNGWLKAKNDPCGVCKQGSEKCEIE